MDNTALISIIKSHRRDSLGYESGDLSQERAKAMDHYHGRPYGNEIVGRSQVVSRDLAETVDWAMPAIMRVFVQTANLAEFSPVGPDDEQLAQQETDYTNQVIMKDNAGFMLLHDAFKDTLLLKNGYVKHWWDEEEKIEEAEYSGITLDQLTKMISDLEAQDAEVEIKEQESSFIQIPGMEQMNPAQQIMSGGGQIEVFEVCLKIKRKIGKVRLMAVPTEEVRVSKRCRGSLQDSPFTEHVTRKTRTELIQMGMDKTFVDSLPAFNQEDNSIEKVSRDSVQDEQTEEGSSINDRSMDEIEFCEAYIKVDFDGDGVAELRKVVTAANKIPPGDDWNEPIPAVALTGFVMKRVPHRHVGESLDDEISDIQEIKTALERQLLDNVYITNNQRTAFNERVNPRDLMVSTPGGGVRVKGDGPVGDALMPIVTQPILDKILPAIDYWDKTKESRSGIRPGSDLDPDMLREVTKGAFLEGLNRLSQKIEMITRMLAESGVKDMVLQVHDLLIRHQDKPRMVQMRGKWVNVDPQSWKSRTDLTVKVGIGTGNEDEKRQKLQALSQAQGALMQACMQAPPQVYAKMYALFEDVAKTMGADVPDKYAIAPNSQEYQQIQQQKPPPGQDPKIVAEGMKQHTNQVIEQMRLEQKTASEANAARFQQAVDQNRQNAEAAQHRDKMDYEARLATLKQQFDERDAMREHMFNMWKTQFEGAVKVEVAEIGATSKVNDAATAAASAEVSQGLQQGPM